MMTKPDTIYTRIDLVNPSKKDRLWIDDVGQHTTTRDLTMLIRGGNLDGRNYVYGVIAVLWTC